MKILFYASSPCQAIGYSRVANIISNHLASLPSVDLYYYSIGVDSPGIDRLLNPKINWIYVHQQLLDYRKRKALPEAPEDYFGVDMFVDTILQVQPDLVLIYNDIVVCNRLIDQIKNMEKRSFSLKVYLDLVYPYEKSQLIQNLSTHVDHLYVFSKYWKDHLLNMGVNKPIGVWKHGYIEFIAPPELSQKGFKTFLGFKEDDFLVLNSNRNCYRKALDLTISAFLQFLKQNDCHPRIKLFMNCSFEERSGYDIVNLIKVECSQLNLEVEKVLNFHIFRPKQLLDDAMLQVLYEASDIGINTCIGEGFGLCNVEHASKGKPQIVSSVGGLKDIFEPIQSVVEPVAEMYIPTIMDWHGGYGKICRAEDFTKRMNQLFHDEEFYQLMSNKTKEYITNHYGWLPILYQIQTDLGI